jgi:hypothetical protein
MGRPGRPPATFAIAALTVGVLGAAVTLGAEEPKEKTKTTTVPGNGPGFVAAKCKRGTQAISGGFETEYDTISHEPNVQIHESRRKGRRTWVAEAWNIPPGAPGALSSVAYCRDEKVKKRSNQITVGQNERAIVTAKCPKGARVLSGGFDAEETVIGEPSPYFYIVASRKVGARKWQVTGQNFGSPGGGLRAFAYCHEGPKLKTAHANAFVSGQNYPTHLYAAPQATCARGQRAVSGGFSQEGDVPAVIRDSANFGRSWRLAASHTPTSPTYPGTTVTVYAYCEKK